MSTFNVYYSWRSNSFLKGLLKKGILTASLTVPTEMATKSLFGEEAGIVQRIWAWRKIRIQIPDGASTSFVTYFSPFICQRRRRGAWVAQSVKH